LSLSPFSLLIEGCHDTAASAFYRGSATPQSLAQDHRCLRLPPQRVRPPLQPVARSARPGACPPLHPLLAERQEGLLGLLQPGRLRPAVLLSGNLSYRRYRRPPPLRQTPAQAPRCPLPTGGRTLPCRRQGSHRLHAIADCLRLRPSPR